MKLKSCPAAYIKAPAAIDVAADDQAGVFEAIVSVFGNADRIGDIVQPGAFADTLAAWKSSPDVLPVLWSHRTDDPSYNIGAVLEAEELAGGDARIPQWASAHLKAHGGLWVKAQLDIGPDASPVAVHARRLLVARRVTQFSYAYDVLDERPGQRDGTNELHKVWLHEVSPTQLGMNELTQLVGGKAPVSKTPPPPAPQGPGAATYSLRCDLAAWELSHAHG